MIYDTSLFLLLLFLGSETQVFGTADQKYPVQYLTNSSGMDQCLNLCTLPHNIHSSQLQGAVIETLCTLYAIKHEREDKH